MSSNSSSRASARLIAFVVALFFVWGFATVLNDTLIPKLKALFSLNYAEVMLTQFCFFIGYLIFSVPAGRLLARLGYLRSIVVGLSIMALGCLLFTPAAWLGVYPMFLLALFIVAAGITMLQVAANPLIAVLGSSESSSARLTMAQAFNSLGTFVGPWVGAALLLSHGLITPDVKRLSPVALTSLRRTEALSVQSLFIGMALILIVLAAVFWFKRNVSVARSSTASRGHSVWIALRDNPRLAFAAASIFTYVGAEVFIGSSMTNFFLDKHAATVTTIGILMSEIAHRIGFSSGTAADAAVAGRLVSFYWGGAMIGRFIGSALLRRLPAGFVLATFAAAACVLACVAASTVSAIAVVTLIAIGLFNSIMFPTIFALGIERLGEQTETGSSVLCMAICGGAIIPLLGGKWADNAGVNVALLLPALCYVWIAFFGIMAQTRLKVGKASATR